MSQALVKQKRKATKKGAVAATAGITTIALATWLSSPFVAVAGICVTGVLTYKWLAYRGKWGIRF